MALSVIFVATSLPKPVVAEPGLLSWLPWGQKRREAELRQPPADYYSRQQTYTPQAQPYIPQTAPYPSPQQPYAQQQPYAPQQQQPYAPQQQQPYAPQQQQRYGSQQPYATQQQPYARQQYAPQQYAPYGSQQRAQHAPQQRAPHAPQQYAPSASQQWELSPPKGQPTLSPNNIAPLNAAIKRYSNIVAQGGWPLVPAVEMREGMSGQPVAILRQRLEASGDMPLSQGGRYSGLFDGNLTQGVKRFQHRHGLSPSGIVDQPTLAALNVRASSRLQQLRANLARLTSTAKATAKRYVVVNIPAAQIEAVENDTVVSRHVAVVGKIDRQTPLLRSEIHEVNFNPYWTVPRSIIRKDLVPKARELARRGENLLDAYRMDVFDAKGRKVNPQQINWHSDAVYNYTYRQEPWEENSLGFVKINFHNKHAVYLHDTPLQKLFGQNYRAESSGCVRVQNVHELVGWLLEGTPGWDINRVQAMEQSGERRDVPLKRRTPVYIVYITAWATPDGLAHFRRDIYRKDGVDQLASTY